MLLLLCFSATLFVGSMQLFLVQPMVAKGVLPLLGGTPAVWNTCMVFFQFALLAGYLYAHIGAKWLDARRQALAHVPLVLLSFLALPLVVSSPSAPPENASTAFWLLQLLITTVGVPFFVASTTAPILQRWFSTTGHRSAKDPYFLYAASNAGSLLALVAYPLIVEPTLRLGDQARLWTIGYAVLAALVAVCAATVWWSSRAPAAPIAPAAPQEAAPAGEAVPTRVTMQERARWIALAFAPSSLLLGVTTFLTTDIAAVPLLWVAPLAIYLLTFVLVFARKAILRHDMIVRALPILVLPVVMMIGLSTQLPSGMQLVVHLLTFFVAAMACHGELARSRPAAEHLTDFYLCMSIGGALGGLFNALVAPVAFTSVLEYPLALAFACLLAIPYRMTWSLRQVSGDVAFAAIVAAGTAGLLLASHRGLLSGKVGMIVLFLLPALACFRFSRQPIRFALGVAVLVVASGSYMDAHDRLVMRDRSFFGVHRITMDPSGQRRLFVHGNTLHGGQHLAAERSRDPLTYYHRNSPIGQIVAGRSAAGRMRSVGVIGLGIGTLAAYGEAGQSWVFYEIDPAVVAIARDPRYFSYLAETKAQVRVVLGDARLSLVDAAPASYDVLVLDAFSSDAIPVHLITREALELYRDKLAPGGVLAFHISNRHLDLEPVLGELAAAVGMTSLTQVDRARISTDLTDYKLSSEWVLMSRSPADLEPFANDPRWQPTRRQPDTTVWTDDFSNVLSVMRWHTP